MNIHTNAEVTKIADDIYVIDEFVPEPILDILVNKVWTYDWPWCYLQDTTYRDKHTDTNTPTWDDGFSTLLYLRAEVGEPGLEDPTKPLTFHRDQLWDYAYPIMSFLETSLELPISKLKRVKVNLSTASLSSDPFEPHIDVPLYQTWTGLLCLNDSDGPTVIYNQKLHNDFTTSTEALRWYNDNKRDFDIIAEVHPKKGRFILFDGRYYHSGSRPSKHKNRINLNINWYK
jgi:hypothetical protein